MGAWFSSQGAHDRNQQALSDLWKLSFPNTSFSSSSSSPPEITMTQSTDESSTWSAEEGNEQDDFEEANNGSNFVTGNGLVSRFFPDLI